MNKYQFIRPTYTANEGTTPSYEIGISEGTDPIDAYRKLTGELLLSHNPLEGMTNTTAIIGLKRLGLDKISYTDEYHYRIIVQEVKK